VSNGGDGETGPTGAADAKSPSAHVNLRRALRHALGKDNVDDGKKEMDGDGKKEMDGERSVKSIVDDFACESNSVRVHADRSHNGASPDNREPSERPHPYLRYDPSKGLDYETYAVLPNDWPYCVPYGVRHFCVWSRVSCETFS
jgi:hypothetical protein